MARRIQATESSFEIIDLLKELDGARMSELSEHLNLATSTIHGHLKTLEANELVVKEGNEYHLSLRFFYYGEFTKRRKPEYEPVQSVVDRIADETGESANFCVAEHGKLIVLFGESIPMDPVYDIGNIFHMHSTAAGKSILAEMPTADRTAVIDRWGLPEHTEHTITDKEALFTELENIRDRGYAYNREELLPGLSSVSTVVKHADGSIVGALSVGGPSYRNRGDRLQKELRSTLLEAKDDLEADIRAIYSPS